MAVKIRLSEVLEERGRTIYWLAKQVDIDFTALYRIRNGQAKGIKFDLLGKICDALDCDTCDLLVLGDDGAPGGKRKEKPGRTTRHR